MTYNQKYLNAKEQFTIATRMEDLNIVSQTLGLQNEFHADMVDAIVDNVESDEMVKEMLRGGEQAENTSINL